MRLALTPFLLALCISTVLFSCSKTHDTTTPPPGKTVDSTTHINYIYLASSYQMNMDSVRQIELILNNQSGILLDTIIAVNTNIVADLKTSGAPVDMTVVTYPKQMQAFYIFTNKAINPAAWTILPGSDSLSGAPPTLPLNNQRAAIYYTNPPETQIQPYYWTASSNTAYGSIYPPIQSTLIFPLLWYQGTYAYIVFPYTAQYNLHYVTTAADTVDLSTINAAERVRFPRPAQYSGLQGYLTGYPDSSNLATALTLSQLGPQFDSIPGADIVYPGKQSFQKYDVSLTYSGNNIYCEYTDPWCDTVNPNPLLPDNSYYTISNSSNNNFSVQFNRQSPGYYSIACTGGMYWSLNVPSDSTIIHPVSYLSSLKSKMLAAQNLNAISVTSFGFSFQVSQNQLVSFPITPATYQPKPQNIPVVTLLTNL